MALRFQNALDIQTACNPSGVTHAIVAAMRECIEEGHDTKTLANDSAVKLMVYQLAYLTGVTTGAEEMAKSTYLACQNECVMRAKA